MADFVALFHVRPFLQSRLAAISPAVDLQYLSLMRQFKELDKRLADIAFHSACNHLWYLTEELVILSLFDDRLETGLRQKMADKLLSYTRPRTFPPGKPKFPVIDLNTIDNPKQLLDFIGPKSWLLFNLLNLKEERLDWLQAPVSDSSQ